MQLGSSPLHEIHCGPQWVDESQARQTPPEHQCPSPQSASPVQMHNPPEQIGAAPSHTEQVAPQWSGSLSPQGSQAPLLHHFPVPH